MSRSCHPRHVFICLRTNVYPVSPHLLAQCSAHEVVVRTSNMSVCYTNLTSIIACSRTMGVWSYSSFPKQRVTYAFNLGQHVHRYGLTAT